MSPRIPAGPGRLTSVLAAALCAACVISVVPLAPALAAEFAVPDNQAPVAGGQRIDVLRDTPVTFALTGYDADDDALTFTPSDPGAGTLSGTASHLTYTPDPAFVGIDSFQFVASDGIADSLPGLIQLYVTTGTPPSAVAPFYDRRASGFPDMHPWQAGAQSR